MTTSILTLSFVLGTTTAPTAGDHIAHVHGLEIHYVVHGSGEPLVLLHGGVGGSEMFEPVLPALVKHHQVIAIDLQGHGRTKDIARPLRYELMADDVAALLGQLGLAKVDVLGYSLGGGVAARLAIQHPDLVRRLGLVSTSFKRTGWYPEVLAQTAAMGPEAAKYMPQSPLAKLYPDTDWANLFTKIGELLRRDYDWTKDAAAIRARTLLVYADADAITLDHEMECYRALGGGKRDAGLDGSGRGANQLAFVPGFTHYNILTAPALASIAATFLE
ncbi:MAG TPA: alpha/beta fold hydrolase [Kofleriaceae bacterium]|nr:alpha/beta fold hydrolase [Kofleriaceae bacterium]